MRCYVQYDDNYLISVGTGYGGTEITEAEYNNILSVIRSRPTPPAGYDYRLKADLTWEQYELPPEPEPSDDDEISDDEAMAIMLGGAV